MFKFKLKKIIVIAGLAALAASGGAQAQTKKIGLAVANLQAEFFNMIKQSVEAYGKEKGYTIITVDAKGDATTQVNQIQDLLTQKIDALIYIPAGATAASVPVKAARAAGIPVVSVDRNADGAPGDTFIRGESIKATTELGEWICKQSGGKGNAVVIHGQKGTSPEVDRMKGFVAGLSKCPGVKITQNQFTERWAADEGAKIAQDMLQRDPSINVIFGQADGIALGAAQAVKLAKPAQKVWVVGYDGDVGGLKAVQSGGLDATVTQPTFTMGRMAVDAVTDLLAGKKPPVDQPMEGVLTTKANVDKFLKSHP
ncbi:sugar ABC transporter substrate-binding protein [Variovorax sp. J22G21]|uniref:sugar ABC transporter substrate-binding protein n=1 Tax=Variovorax fucosicus TaxID=3053517 RepID=UPI002574D93C|nr:MULTISPECIES: sugar ABC transporter substrate-binding protein [unclassified Variovorax]MDM0038248.1 sugar ABC transporter substrate-binding protein [Variovorax sp. J22R193]MDM0063024.1 sugar ABC transporter substrate-binding protein [Variovorax sp. J22G21]